MSAPSAARRTAWLRPCPRAAPVTSATLPARRPLARSIRPAGVDGGCAHVVAPVVSVVRAVGRGHADLEGAAPALEYGFEDTCGARRSHRPAVCPDARGRGPRRAGGGRSRRPRRPVCRGWRPSTCPPGGPGPPRSDGAGPAAPAAPRPAAAGCWRRPGRRSATAACRRSGRGSPGPRRGPRPASHSATPTPTGPPTGSMDDHRTVGQGAGRRRRGRRRRRPRHRSVRRHRRRGRAAPGGEDHGRTVAPGRVEVGRPSPRCRCRRSPPAGRTRPPASPARPASRSRPGPTAADRQRPAGSVGRARATRTR